MTDLNNNVNDKLEVLNMPRWVLVDGTGLLHRAYHAFGNMKAPGGHSNSVVYGTLYLMNKFLKGLNGPDHLVMIFDAPGGSLERLALYPEYKAQRPPRPEEITRQEPWVHAFLRASGIPVVHQAGVESDDIMASIAKKESIDKRIAILSSDKDMGTTVNGNVLWFRPDNNSENGIKRMTKKVVFETFGVLPHQISDFLALQGDTADNLPGVDKVGKQTAAKLLGAFGSIDGIYEAISKEDGLIRLAEAVGSATSKKIWEPLNEAKDWIKTMQSLVNLRDEVPVPKESYANREAVNDQMMEDLRAEHGLPPWMGYFLPWQQERATMMNQAKRSSVNPKL